MARAIDRHQVEQWLTEGASLRQIARRLGLPLTTFYRRWQRLQREAAPPVSGEVTELPARPGPPPGPPARVESRLPEGPPAVHPGLPPELQAIQQDLLDLVAWWRERQRARVHPEVHPRATRRWTVHTNVRWIQAVKQEAAREGEPLMAVVNRALQQYFEGRST
jgi:AcrR family transcriptional regulator